MTTYKLKNAVGKWPAGTEITAQQGMLWAMGTGITLPLADLIAQDGGFQHAEEMVKSLTATGE